MDNPSEPTTDRQTFGGTPLQSLTVFLAAAIGMGVVYFIGRKVSIPAGLDTIVSVIVIVMTVVLAAVSGALGTTFEEPPPAYAGLPDDACAPGFPKFENLPCVTVLQARIQAQTQRNLIQDSQAIAMTRSS
jgi:hypothetical protein